MAERRARGVRLADLDRSKVYRLGWVGRRWEVLGPEPAPDGAGAAMRPQPGSPGGGAPGGPAAPAPRHRADAAVPDQAHHVV